ncbi:MAG: hypothetical protein M3Z14_02150 [Candidatus Eremiobacteraeota bacterium]|nr:hypothetical protein [Candidatus Eremiobacteraeota bacterium]
MVSADAALVQFVNNTTTYYTAHQPAYMTYRSRTHIAVPSLRREAEIDRHISVRVRDNFAIMRDLPQGSERQGQAFPVIAYFDPLAASFRYEYPAFIRNFRINRDFAITLDRGTPLYFATPTPDPGITVVASYSRYYYPTFAADSSDAVPHLHLEVVPQDFRGPYPSDIVMNTATNLPSQIRLRSTAADTVVTFDYALLEQHWIITHFSYEETQSAAIARVHFKTETTFDQFSFPVNAPDPRLAG